MTRNTAPGGGSIGSRPSPQATPRIPATSQPYARIVPSPWGVRRGPRPRRSRGLPRQERSPIFHNVTARTDQKVTIALTVNGERTEVAFSPHKTLLEVLREDLALTGTKHGCELGECGTCTVQVDDVPVLSCLMLGLDAEDREVKTIEGMADGAELHPLQQTFADLGAAQCGYCSPGFLLVAEELLKKSPNPSRAEIQEALSGNLCRCTGYIKIYEAVELAAQQIRGE